MKPKISVWAAKTWKTVGKCEKVYCDQHGNLCVLGAAAKAIEGHPTFCEWHGTEEAIEKLMRYNDRPETTKAQVLAYARRLGL
jgi:hypothetical protein